MYSAYNEEKSIIAERFIRTLTKKKRFLNIWQLFKKMFILM